ncbi:amino acid adenylation domain-containing protein [Spirillospora sp. CA-255316]
MHTARNRPLLPGQQALLAEEGRDAALRHLLYNVRITGTPDPPRLAAAIEGLARRHPALRTSFVADGEAGPYRRIDDRWRPALHEQHLPPDDTDLLERVQAVVARSCTALLAPFAAPPVVFVLTTAPGSGAGVLSLLAHRAALDDRSVRLLLRELADFYASGSDFSKPLDHAEGLDGIAARWSAMCVSGEADALAAERAAQLSGAPTTVELPGDLRRPAEFGPEAARIPFTLSPEAAGACDRLAGSLGLTRSAALLGAWALVVARYCDLDELLVGTPMSSDPDLVGPCSQIVPVRCRLPAGLSVADYLRGVGDAMGEAARYADLPLDRLADEMELKGDDSRNRLVQIAFASDGELPRELAAGDTRFQVTDGFCGATAFDAMLRLRSWDENTARLALEYPTGVLLPGEAAGLAESLDAALVRLGADPEAALTGVNVVSHRQERLLHARGSGGAADIETGLWELFAAQADSRPQAPAVRGDGPPITYGELRVRIEALAGRLAEAGVGEGDHVVVSVPRSPEEIVAVLAAVRLGAAYVGMDEHSPPTQQAAVLSAVSPRAIITGDPRSPLALRAASGCALVDPVAVGSPDVPPPPAPDPDRVTYVSFTSGSTGTPKGVRVPERGVLRLIRDDYVLRGPEEGFLRVSPLAFDLSTFEVFTPLASGARVEVFPGDPLDLARLARFLDERRVTVLWLTSGLFRLFVDHHADAFDHVRQVLAGGDVVPPEQVRTLLHANPHLRVTNGYGPTENTTFTTVHHVDSAAEVVDPLPIGRPIAGTHVSVRDRDGRPVPPGAVGELWTGGLGLALDYIGDPAATAEAFHGPEGDGRLYRTGDLVRWDTRGRLRYLGRRDRQVKVGGHRIELSAIEHVLRRHRGVQDAFVGVIGADASDGRLLVGVVPANSSVPTDTLREHVAQRLPSYAVPSLWAQVAAIPVTDNGKVDLRALHESALAQAQAST